MLLYPVYYEISGRNHAKLVDSIVCRNYLWNEALLVAGIQHTQKEKDRSGLFHIENQDVS